MSDLKTVKVNICASQVVHYNQTYDMDVADWEKYCLLVHEKNPDKAIAAIAEKYLDFGVVSFSEDIEDVGFTKYLPLPARGA